MKAQDRTRQEVSTFLIMIGIIVLINIISVRTFFRLDLTKNQSYSLSSVSNVGSTTVLKPLSPDWVIST